MNSYSRRSFLRGTAAGALAASGPRYLKSQTPASSDSVALALIGARNQGRGVALRSIAAGARITVLCDIDDAIAVKVSAELEKAQGKTPACVKDFRRVLDRKDVDAVIVATPDHWHTHMAILACQAGKDVFLEKPVSQTIREGQLIRDAARRYGRVMQIGTMRRSAEHFRTAAEFVGSGKLGKICLVKAWMCQVRKSIGNPPDGSPPDGADYDMWLGPAPLRPFNPNRFHYNWRFFWDYGNSELGNQGVHMLDVALWGIQKMRGTEKCLPTRVSGHGGIYWLDDAKEVPDTQVVNYDFGDLLLVWELRSFSSGNATEGTEAGTAFYGTEGTLIVDGNGWRVHGSRGEPGRSAGKEPFQHEKNFLDCVKSREKPNADIEVGRLSTTLCHLGNIAHHLKRDVRFDPATETFPGDATANGLLEKSYRSSYPLPAV